MAQSDSLGRKPLAAGSTLLSGADNPLVRAVGRVPVKVRTKMLVAFAGITALLIVVAVLGLRVLGQANARVESLGTLQLRALRVGDDPSLRTYLGGGPTSVPEGRNWALADQAIAAALSQLGPATNETRFGFVPPPEDEARLVRIRADYGRLAEALKQVTALDRAGAPSAKTKQLLTAAIDADNDLGAQTNRLAATTRAKTNALIAQNHSSYAASRNLFIGVGAGSIALALLLGFVLSWSLVGPIQRKETRLADIAAGDFSKH